MRNGLLVYLMLALMLNVIPQLALTTPQTFEFSVRVTDLNGSTMKGVTVLVFNLRTIRAVYTGYTDENGIVTGSLPSNEYYIVYVLNTAENVLTHVPVRIDLSTYPNVISLKAHVILYPAARIVTGGRIVYIGGQPTGSARITILNREGEPLSRSLEAGTARLELGDKRELNISPKLIDSYGPTGDYTFIKRGIGSDILKVNEALVPLNIPLRARIEYSVLDLNTFRIETLGVERGSRESPLIFASLGQVEVVDLLSVSLEGQLNRAKQELSEARDLASLYEAMGFYIPEIHDLLRVGEGLIVEAESLFAQKEAPERVISPLERVHAISTDQIPKRLGFLRDIAKVGATVMPSFLAVFAAILAFYFFNSQRAKMLSFTVIYAALALSFTYVYPGFRLLWSLDQSLFLATVAGGYAVFFIVVFLLPRFIKEPELPGEVQMRGLVAVAFTLGKRYSKVKALRTFITVFSITAFIWAFTVLATFGSVYAKIEEKGFAEYPFNVLVVKRVVNDTLSALNAELDPLLFLGRGDIQRYSTVVFNRPDMSMRAAISYGGREVVLRFAMGIDENEFRNNPYLGTVVTRPVGRPDNNSIILPESAWNLLGLKGGEVLDVTLETGYGSRQLKLTAVGYFNELAFEEVRDPDGIPMRPFIIRNGRMLFANGSDLFITSSQLLLSLFPPEEGGYSQVFFPYRISSQPVSEEAGTAFINEVVDRRGESYVGISCYGGRCSRVYYGTRVQSLFEQDITFFVPLFIVIANVLLSMVSVVRERRREIFIFMTVGFNPRQIALVFLAEAVVYGLLSGGFGYIAGLTTFRLLSTFAAYQNLMVREKLEWYWSYLAIALAVVVSIVGAIKPSMDAAYMFAPTEVRRLRISERRERAKRVEYVTRTTAAKTFSIPGEILADEGEVAFSYVYSKLADLSYGELEAVEGLVDHPMEERFDGTRIKRFTFRYLSTTEIGVKATIECELRFILSPKAESYRVELETKPVGQAPISHMDYAADLIKRIVNDWMNERERLLFAA